ncbi:hypothetical protein F4818DRAFT_438219 [Hypoxylon cercidicola]|nr:hypothetical protein F4818DRAFT_438219 [Hypoxylon cercidicola]
MAVESRALLSPLSSEDLEDCQDSDYQHDQDKITFTLKNDRSASLPVLTILIVVLCALLVGTNIAWAYTFAYTTSNQAVDNYYGARDIQTTFHFDWVNLQPGDNETRYADQKWEALFPRGGGRVALSQDIVGKLSLPASVAATHDPEKRVYQIAGYHQLHCLDKIRDVLHNISDLQNGVFRDDAKPYLNGSNWDHVLHCIEGVRQGLVCRIDETLLPVKETWPPIGDGSGQQRTCKNAPALRDWAERNMGSENRQWSLHNDH